MWSQGLTYQAAKTPAYYLNGATIYFLYFLYSPDKPINASPRMKTIIHTGRVGLLKSKIE